MKIQIPMKQGCFVICFLAICSGALAQDAPRNLGSATLALNATSSEKDPAPAASAPAEPDSHNPCGVHALGREAWWEARQFGHGLAAAPRNSIRPSNLKWELPIGAVTGILIAEVDRTAANRIQLQSFQHLAGRWSNIGLGVELGSSVLAYGVGCAKRRIYLRNTGFKMLAAMGAANTLDVALKYAFDRQHAYAPNSTGKFWGGGRSFPSGHAATSFAFAAVIAHRYPHHAWIKWGAYALATGVSLSRYPAKKHFPSDILVGATLGYVTGTYIADH
jgi:membrane-associated phospholipid phosphatase